jgi:hypothetical protein
MRCAKCKKPLTVHNWVPCTGPCMEDYCTDHIVAETSRCEECSALPDPFVVRGRGTARTES